MRMMLDKKQTQLSGKFITKDYCLPWSTSIMRREKDNEDSDAWPYNTTPKTRYGIIEQYSLFEEQQTPNGHS